MGVTVEAGVHVTADQMRERLAVTRRERTAQWICHIPRPLSVSMCHRAPMGQAGWQTLTYLF